MRIAITGSHGVGKTTLAQRLACDLGVSLLKEAAREVAAELYYPNTASIAFAPMDKKEDFQNKVLQRQITNEAVNRNFISDRAVIDIYAYSAYYGLNWQPHFDWIMCYSGARYSALIYVPIPDADIHDDGFRLTDLESQQEIDKMVLHMAKQLECPLIELSRNRDNWYKEALHGIEVVRRDKRKRVKNALIGDDGDGK